jgi:hypothetical protein
MLVENDIPVKRLLLIKKTEYQKCKKANRIEKGLSEKAFDGLVFLL